MRRPIVPILMVLVLASACGGGKKESALTSDEATASPTAAASLAPGRTAGAAKASAQPAGGTSAAKPATGGGTGAKAAAPKVVAGGYQPPKPGTYLYRMDGEATSPMNPSAGPQKFSNETLTKKVSQSGNVVTTEQSTSVQAGRVTQRMRWETDRVLLTYVKAETSQGDYTCEFNPPLLITRFPVRPGTIPTQQFKGSGNACKGSLDITIERRESTKDAGGKAWDGWRVHVKTQSTFDQFAQKTDDTRWVSPQLSIEVRSTGTFQITGPGGRELSRGTNTTALKSYPK